MTKRKQRTAAREEYERRHALFVAHVVPLYATADADGYIALDEILLGLMRMRMHCELDEAWSGLLASTRKVGAKVRDDEEDL